jgi:hypothetical protein
MKIFSFIILGHFFSKSIFTFYEFNYLKIRVYVCKYYYYKCLYITCLKISQYYEFRFNIIIRIIETSNIAKSDVI